MKSMNKIVVFLVLSTNVFCSSISICQNCHGKYFEKRALGKSKVVKNMKKEDIIKALREFKISDSIMKSYASRLNDKQIIQIGNIFGK
ncbi:hypothetical protein ACKGJI_11410 [Sulfurospirillum sp. 1307]